jgi:SAM-dependent methyltransferase
MLRKLVNLIVRSFQAKRPNHRRIFSKIYSDFVWGNDNQRSFYSGTGSDDIYAEPYAATINEFIKKHNIKSMVDLGCGDFRVGNKIVSDNNVNYIGIDVVPELIAHNNKFFRNSSVRFLCKNIVRQKLPVADLCVIRQVLQHLSNDDILRVLKKCKQYKYLIVTEHLPIDTDIVANVDKRSNEHIRLNVNSGVYLNQSPFNKLCVELLTVFPTQEPGSKITTMQVLN